MRHRWRLLEPRLDELRGMSSSCFTSNMSCSLSSSSVHLHSQAWQKVRAATGFAGTPNSNRMLCWLCTNFASNFRTVGPTSALLPTLLQTLQQAWPSSYRRCRRMEYSLVYSLAIASILPGSWHIVVLVHILGRFPFIPHPLSFLRTPMAEVLELIAVLLLSQG